MHALHFAHCVHVILHLEMSNALCFLCSLELRQWTDGGLVGVDVHCWESSAKCVSRSDSSVLRENEISTAHAQTWRMRFTIQEEAERNAPEFVRILFMI